MSESKSEQVLQALFAALRAGLPPDVAVERNIGVPSRIPAGGIAILYDGNSGAPEYLFSPPTYFYEHRAEVDVVVDAPSAEARDLIFDRIKIAISEVLAADRSLGGICDYVLGEAPAPLDLPMEGAEGLKAATIGIILPYDTPDPLA